MMFDRIQPISLESRSTLWTISRDIRHIRKVITEKLDKLTINFRLQSILIPRGMMKFTQLKLWADEPKDGKKGTD